MDYWKGLSIRLGTGGIAIVLCCICCVLQQMGDAQAVRPGNAGEAAVPPEMRTLYGLIGMWIAREHWEKAPGWSPGGEGTGIEKITSGPGGMSLIIDYESSSGPFATYSGHGILSWDVFDKCYRMAWSQPMLSGISIETGSYDGEHLVLTYKINESGRDYVVENVYSEMRADSFQVTSYMIGPGNQRMKTLTLALQRKR